MEIYVDREQSRSYKYFRNEINELERELESTLSEKEKDTEKSKFSFRLISNDWISWFTTNSQFVNIQYEFPSREYSNFLVIAIDTNDSKKGSISICAMYLNSRSVWVIAKMFSSTCENTHEDKIKLIDNFLYELLREPNHRECFMRSQFFGSGSIFHFEKDSHLAIVYRNNYKSDRNLIIEQSIDRDLNMMHFMALRLVMKAGRLYDANKAYNQDDKECDSNKSKLLKQMERISIWNPSQQDQLRFTTPIANGKSTHGAVDNSDFDDSLIRVVARCVFLAKVIRFS